jgi:hypothetical protein
VADLTNQPPRKVGLTVKVVFDDLALFVFGHRTHDEFGRRSAAGKHRAHRGDSASDENQ